MAFMRLEVWQDRVHVDAEGNDWPSCSCPDDARPTRRRAWFGRYSAPGYMDATDPCGPYASPAAAARGTFDLYGSDEPDQRAELAALLWQVRRWRDARSPDEAAHYRALA